MMVAEQVQPRLHRREDLVDRRLAGVDARVRRTDAKRPRRLVRQEHVDAAQRLARLDLLADEMPAPVGQLGRLRACPSSGAAARAAGVSYQRRRERAAEAGHAQARRSSSAVPFGDVVQVRPADRRAAIASKLSLLPLIQ